ncbi:MAG TPA: cytochrome c oxidase subunit II [Opitutaceae bacterium]|jgi:cytochrome c oxidase subunit 2
MRFSPIFDPVSSQATAILRVSVVGFVVAAVIFVGVTVWVVYSLIRFRARLENPEVEKPAFGNLKLEIAWTLVPVLIVIFLFAITARGMRLSDPPADRDPDILVIAHQWWWEIDYLHTGVLTANELHIPVGRKLLLRLESADVIHDFWAPQLGRKIDMVPGHPNSLWIEADRTGAFSGSCGEYCGTQHAWMRFTVFADTPDDFGHWQEAQRLSARVARLGRPLAGQQLFTQLTCVNCHALRGTQNVARVAPDLTHFASRTTLGAGVLPNSPPNLARWLLNPQDVKPGCLMPNFQLNTGQVADLVAYMETLK